MLTEERDNNSRNGYYSCLRRILWIIGLLWFILAVLFILKLLLLLPKSLSRFLSSALFWPTVPLTLLERAGRYISRVDDNVIVGAAPYGFLNIPELLHDTYNVHAVINLCEEYKGPTRNYEALGLQQLHLPTPDHFEPSVEQMIRAVEFIEQYRSEGKTVYVHCKAGHGRSAAIVFAWLLSKNPNVNRKQLNQDLCRKRFVRSTLWKQLNIIEFHNLQQLTTTTSKNDKLDHQHRTECVSNDLLTTATLLLYGTSSVFTAVGFISVILYILNHKSMLPKPISAVVSKVLFWPTMPIVLAIRFGHYISTIDETLILGSVPVGVFRIPELLAESYNVSAVINMCEEFQGPLNKYKQLGIEQLWLPTVDHVEPSVEYLERAVSFIAQCKSQRRKVYVHCKAGHGRAAAVAFAWLLYKDPKNAKRNKELNDELRRIRRVRRTLWKQENIMEFHSRLLKRQQSEIHSVDQCSIADKKMD